MSNRQTKYRKSGRQVAVVLTDPDAILSLEALECQLASDSRPVTKAAIELALRIANGSADNDRQNQ